MNKCVLTLTVLAMTLVAGHSQTQPGSVNPKDGFVPNADVAVKIAEAVLIPVYSEKKILSERPFTAKLQGDVWTVEGALHCPNGAKDCFGGTAVVKISKSSGQILHMTHYR
jgi:NTF2 fold immunity protein